MVFDIEAKQYEHISLKPAGRLVWFLYLYDMNYRRMFIMLGDHTLAIENYCYYYFAKFCMVFLFLGLLFDDHFLTVAQRMKNNVQRETGCGVLFTSYLFSIVVFGRLRCLRMQTNKKAKTKNTNPNYSENQRKRKREWNVLIVLSIKSAKIRIAIHKFNNLRFKKKAIGGVHKQ